jgi:hypothetical protein
MTPEYSRAYEFLYSVYIYDSPRRRFNNIEIDFIRMIKYAIDISDPTMRLRSDAKFFLMVNFHQMIIRPLIDHPPFKKSDSNIPPEDLRIAIEEDINSIVKGSIINTNEFKGGEGVSGHEIMKSIDQLWSSLKTTKFELWG